MKFLVSADFHIRDRAGLALLERALRTAVRENCRAVLIAGDLFDSPCPAEELAAEAAAALAECRMPVYIAAGNHDPLELSAFWKKMPENVTVFPKELSGFDLGDIRLYGYSAMREHETTDRIGQDFRAEGAFPVLLAHGQLDASSPYLPVSSRVLDEAGFRLAVLGHTHKAADQQTGGCRILVPGIPEGRGWDETGNKFIYTAEAGPGGLSVLPFSIAAVRYTEKEIDLTGAADTGEILSRMKSAVPAPGEKLRLILTGSPERDPGEAVSLYEAETGRTVRDRSSLLIPLEELCSQKTLQGAFVRLALNNLAEKEGKEREIAQEALELGLKALTGRLAE